MIRLWRDLIQGYLDGEHVASGRELDLRYSTGARDALNQMADEVEYWLATDRNESR